MVVKAPSPRAAQRSKISSRPDNKEVFEQEEERQEEGLTLDKTAGFIELLFGISSRTDDSSYTGTTGSYVSSLGEGRDDDPSPYHRGSSFGSDASSSIDNVAEDPEQIAFDRDLRSRHALACKYLRSAKFSKALRKFESILSLLLDRFGESHARVGAALHNVGIANLRAGRLNDAMDAIEEAVRIRKLTLGEDDPKVADSLVELGIIQLSLKSHKAALETFEEALEMREDEAEDMVEPEDVNDSTLKIAKLLNNIGCVHYETRDYASADDAIQDAINMQQEVLGNLEKTRWSMKDSYIKPGFLTMASTMVNKGYIELDQKKYAEAIATLLESLEIQKVLLGPENKLIINTLDNLGYAYVMVGNWDSAISSYQEIRESQEDSYKGKNPEYAATLKKLAYAQVKKEAYEDALQTLGDLLHVQIQLYGPRNEAVDETENLRGLVNYQVLKYPGFMCFTCGDDEEVVTYGWKPKMPSNGSKMSGHRVTYA